MQEREEEKMSQARGDETKGRRLSGIQRFQNAVVRTQKQLQVVKAFNQLASHTAVYGSSDKDAKPFDDAEVLDGKENVAVVETVTVYTRKLDDGEFVIADIAVGYNVDGTSEKAVTHHPAAQDALATSFGIPPGNTVLEMSGVFSAHGLAQITFETNKREHNFGHQPRNKAQTFRLKLPIDKRLLALKGSISCSAAGEAAALRTLGFVLAKKQYLDAAAIAHPALSRPRVARIPNAQYDAINTSQSSNTSEKRRKLTRSRRREPGAASSAEVSVNGALEQQQQQDQAIVRRRWVHPLGGEYDGEWRGDAWSGRGVYTWSNGDRYVGQVEDSLAHGWGVMTFAGSQDTYNGSFVRGA